MPTLLQVDPTGLPSVDGLIIASCDVYVRVGELKFDVRIDADPKLIVLLREVIESTDDYKEKQYMEWHQNNNQLVFAIACRDSDSPVRAAFAYMVLVLETIQHELDSAAIALANNKRPRATGQRPKRPSRDRTFFNQPAGRR